MRRILALGLILSTLLALTACGGSAKKKLEILDTAYANEDYAIGIAKENTPLLEQVNTALGELIQDGTTKAIVDKYISGTKNSLVFQKDAAGKPELTMGTNAEFPPYEYYDGDAIVGIDAEIAAAIADKLGMKLVIQDMAFDAIIPALQTGKIDMAMAGMTVTDERKQAINFTQSYAAGVQVIIVPEGSKITSADDLSKKGADFTIGVQTGTTGDLYATWDLEDNKLATVQRYNKGADAVAALVSGKIDCVIIDNEPAKKFVESNNK